LTAGTLYLNTDVAVQSGAALTITGGTVVTFTKTANIPYAGGLSAKNELIVENGGRLAVLLAL
jgi:hypothetical protein